MTAAALERGKSGRGLGAAGDAQAGLPGGPCKAALWHPRCDRLAVAADEDRVRVSRAPHPAGRARSSQVQTLTRSVPLRPQVYDLDRGCSRGTVQDAADCVSVVLQHELQRGVRGLQWRASLGQSLAVACEGGICLWAISARPVLQNNIVIGKATEMNQLSASLTFLKTPAPTASLSWSPDGRLLASLGAGESTIRVWDAALGTHTPVSPGLVAGSLTFVRWSPAGNYLLAASASKKFYLWETDSWECVEWSCGAELTDAVWGEGDRFFIAAMKGTSQLVVMQFSQPPPSLNMHVTPLVLPGLEHAGAAAAKGGAGRPSWNRSGQFLALPAAGADPTVHLFSIHGILSGGVGGARGAIRALTWDPSWKHLAVSLAQPDGAEATVVYALQSRPVVKAALLGFICA